MLEVALGIDMGLDCSCAASGASGGRPGTVDHEPSMHTPISLCEFREKEILVIELAENSLVPKLIGLSWLCA